MVTERLALASEDVIKAKTYGRGNPVNGLTFHETANPRRGANADMHARLQAGGNVRNASWHVQGDDTEVVRSFESDVRCWHAGDGDKADGGNMTFEAYEMCVNEDGDYDAALALAIEWFRQRRAETGLGRDAVKQHFDHSQKDCPRILRGLGPDAWQRFVAATDPDYGEESDVRSVSQRIAHATRMIGNRSYAGWCEKFVRECFGFPARNASATIAWNRTKIRHRNINNAPAGVPIFWELHPANRNYGLGHVAISVGGGYCISTSVGPGGAIGKVKIADLTRAWGMTVRGWTEDYHGKRVYTAPKPSKPSKGRKSGRVPHTDWTVSVDGAFGRYTALALQNVLRHNGYRTHAMDGSFGSHSIRSLQRFLRAKGYRGHAIDGRWGSWTTRSLQQWLRDLGYRGHAIDGSFGPYTVRSLQQALIDGQFFRR